MMINFTSDVPGARQLLYDMIIRAYRDAINPPSEQRQRSALDFLRCEGAEIIEALGVTTAEKVRRWAANPRPATGLRTSEIAARAGIDKDLVKQAIATGELPAFLPGSKPQGYRVRESDATTWLHFRRIYPGGKDV